MKQNHVVRPIVWTAKVSGTTTKHYANGIEYNNTALEAVYFAEGRVVPGSPWKYQYTLKDHPY